MAKHAVPKHKKSKPRSRRRHSAFERRTLGLLSNMVKLIDCPDCGAKMVSHTACTECGKYRGRQVIDKKKEIDKITKIKA